MFKNLMTGQSVYVERLWSALYKWTVGKCVVKLGKEPLGLFSPAMTAAGSSFLSYWENSNSPIKGARSSALCLLTLTSTGPFHYIPSAF